jgi:hypothetical protein
MSRDILVVGYTIVTATLVLASGAYVSAVLLNALHIV